MDRVRLVMFDLSGTTVEDDAGVGECLHRAAEEFSLQTSLEEILSHLGTNKIHLYQYLIARRRGREIPFADFEREQDPATQVEARRIFDRYQELMIAHYRGRCREIPGASETFRWCHAHDILVATGTGFHRAITATILDQLGWVRDGLVDAAVDVEHIPGEIGRPAPYMIFHAMTRLRVQSVRSVVKVGDTPADMLEGRNAGCAGVVGVLTGARPIEDWGGYRHTHVIRSVADLPALLKREFL
jgi:phosphonatase-like hydrolase